METNTQRNGSRVLTLVAPSVPGPERVAPITESTARLLGTAAILGLGLIHILDAASTYNSTRWIFWAYMALIVAVVPVALFLLHSTSPLGWTAAASLAAGPLVAYLWSRSIRPPRRRAGCRQLAVHARHGGAVRRELSADAEHYPPRDVGAVTMSVRRLTRSCHTAAGRRWR